MIFRQIPVAPADRRAVEITRGVNRHAPAFSFLPSQGTPRYAPPLIYLLSDKTAQIQFSFAAAGSDSAAGQRAARAANRIQMRRLEEKFHP